MTDTLAKPRIFLVVVDDSPELKVALHYACLRAQRSGGKVALLYTMEPIDSQAWMAVEELMREEKREQAEKMVKKLSQEVYDWSGTMPIVYLREGLIHEELLRLIEEDPSISILVLGASAGSEGPGPLVSYLIGKVSGRLRVPVTIVPGTLNDDQLAVLT